MDGEVVNEMIKTAKVGQLSKQIISPRKDKTMNAVTETTIFDIETAINEVMPLLSDQKVVYGQLLDSIAYCQELGSSAWSVSLHDKRGFRLNVGQVEAMTLGFKLMSATEFEIEKDVTFADIRLLLAGEDCQAQIPTSDDHGFFKEMPYTSPGAKNWCYSNSFSPATGEIPDPRRVFVQQDLATLRSNHQQFLKLACHTSTGKIRQKGNFARFHVPAIVEYAIRVVKSVRDS
jgi:hypothetical protein